MPLVKDALIVALITSLSGGTAIALELEDRDVEVYGFNIHYAESGDGPVVILLHGLWGGTNEWQPVIEPLSKKYRVIAMDFIGFHRSAKPEASYHNALLSQFLAGFIDALALEDVTLMGHAMGANAATYTAFHHPEQISRLILVDGAGYRNPDRDLGKPMSEGMIRFRRTERGRVSKPPKIFCVAASWTHRWSRTSGRSRRFAFG